MEVSWTPGRVPAGAESVAGDGDQEGVALEASL